MWRKQACRRHHFLIEFFIQYDRAGNHDDERDLEHHDDRHHQYNHNDGADVDNDDGRTHDRRVCANSG